MTPALSVRVSQSEAPRSESPPPEPRPAARRGEGSHRCEPRVALRGVFTGCAPGPRVV